jgi:uncharacterized protein YjbJ (UPF0337 family)
VTSSTLIGFPLIWINDDGDRAPHVFIHGRRTKASSPAVPFAGSNLEEGIMDNDRAVGAAKELKGAIKQGVGKAVGDAKLEADGKADKAEGKIQNAVGGLKDTVRESLKGK